MGCVWPLFKQWEEHPFKSECLSWWLMGLSRMSENSSAYCLYYDHDSCRKTTGSETLSQCRGSLDAAMESLSLSDSWLLPLALVYMATGSFTGRSPKALESGSSSQYMLPSSPFVFYYPLSCRDSLIWCAHWVSVGGRIQTDSILYSLLKWIFDTITQWRRAGAELRSAFSTWGNRGQRSNN